MGTSFTSDRSHRRQRQWVTFQTLLEAIPDAEDLADALFATWPQRVPRAVWTGLSVSLRQAWRQRRADFEQSRFEAWVQGPLTTLAERFGIEAEAAEAGVTAILGLVESLPRLHHLTLFLDPDDEDAPRGLSQSWAAQDLQDPDQRETFEQGLAIVLTLGGSLRLVEQMPLRVQRPGPTGELVWAFQERWWGAFFGWGQIFPLAASAVRELATGQAVHGHPVASVAGLSFGDLYQHAVASHHVEPLIQAGVFTP